MQTNKAGLTTITPESPVRAFREAFLNAKAKFKPVLKTESNPFFQSKYASLKDYHDAVDNALQANGFALHQLLESDGASNYLITKLTHVDGYDESSRVLIRSNDDADPQKFGSCLTYLRRYCLAAILGVPSEDDDGNKGSEPGAGISKTVTTNKPPASGQKSFNKTAPISEGQLKRFYAIAKSKHWPGECLNNLLGFYGLKDPAEISWGEEYKTIIEELEIGPKNYEFQDPSQPPPITDDNIRNPFHD